MSYPPNDSSSSPSLDAFLSSVEKRAYKHAFFAVRNEENALDIVQDAMFNLVQSYRDKPSNEWPLLFSQILQNAINTHFRRQKVREQWTPNFSQFDTKAPDETSNALEIIETLLDKTHGHDYSLSTEDQVASLHFIEMIEKLIKNLPTRQREAFLLRYWQELSVNETAQIMGCSIGSVKTHCSRAIQNLTTQLAQLGITGPQL